MFAAWCEERGFALEQLEPSKVAAYIEELGQQHSIPTVKQHLAAIRRLFDYLVVGQVIPFNPAAAVRGPRYSVNTGKTPVLYQEEARKLLTSINSDTVIGLRDRAMISIMTYAFARVGAVVNMRVKDYKVQDHNAWFILHEKGGKYRRIPAHHKAAEAVDAYIEAAQIAADRNGFLFRAGKDGRGGGGYRGYLTTNPCNRTHVYRMLQCRAKAVGLSEITCHTFRATGITDYLLNGGEMATAAEIAGHADMRTTNLYNRARDKVTRSEIERIRI